MVSKSKRVVVTGMGIMSSLGKDPDQYWDALVNGVSGIGNITLCDAEGFPNDLSLIHI